MPDPTKSALSIKEFSERTSETTLKMDSPECIAWTGPMGMSRAAAGNRGASSVPAVWCPGFLYELDTHLEAWVIPKHVVKSFNLIMSTGFWGAKPKQRTRVNRALAPGSAFPVPTVDDETPLTDDDIERIEEDLLNAGEEAGDLRARFDKNSEELNALRAFKLKKIEDNLVRVRILATPGLNFLPRPEDYEVQVIGGGFPDTARIGGLLDAPDKTGTKFAVAESFGWTQAEYEQYLGSLKNIPQSTSGAIQSRIRSQQMLLKARGRGPVAAVIPIPGVIYNRDTIRGPALQLTQPAKVHRDPRTIDTSPGALADLGFGPVDAVTIGISTDPAFRRANPDRLHPNGDVPIGDLA